MNWNELTDLFVFDFDSLLAADWGQTWLAVRESMLDPSSNLPVAILVLIITSIVVTIALVAVLMFVMGSREADDYEWDEDSVEVVVNGGDLPAAAADLGVEQPHIEIVRRKRNPYVTVAVGVAVFAVSWWALAYGTSRDDICLSCHVETPHTDALAQVHEGELEYIHDGARCVDCHESDGLGGLYGFEVLHRSAHFVFGFGISSQNDYGAVTEAACLDCHGPVANGDPLRNELRGVYMSHAEPRDAGWRCVDCHQLQGGLLLSGTRGMTGCISCHDNQTATAACTSCHYTDVAVAASVGSPRGADMASALIPTPDCGGCHNQVTECDPCHNGVRMPHNRQFIIVGHAREAVENFWYGDGNACFGCHTKERNSCSNCHEGDFWNHGRQLATLHTQAAKDSTGCTRCHDRTEGHIPDRNFCVGLCHQERTEWLEE